MNSTIPPKYRGKFLVGLAGVLALQVPSTVADIEDPTVRSLVQLAFIFVALFLAYSSGGPKEPPMASPKPLRDDGPVTNPETPQSKQHQLRSLGVA